MTRVLLGLSLLHFSAALSFGESLFDGDFGLPPSGNALWYRAPANNWVLESLPIGNGYLGGSISFISSPCTLLLTPTTSCCVWRKRERYRNPEHRQLVARWTVCRPCEDFRMLLSDTYPSYPYLGLQRRQLGRLCRSTCTREARPASSYHIPERNGSR
jgi:hypothetical protein